MSASESQQYENVEVRPVLEIVTLASYYFRTIRIYQGAKTAKRTTSSGVTMFMHVFAIKIVIESRFLPRRQQRSLEVFYKSLLMQERSELYIAHIFGVNIL